MLSLPRVRVQLVDLSIGVNELCRGTGHFTVIKGPSSRGPTTACSQKLCAQSNCVVSVQMCGHINVQSGVVEFGMLPKCAAR